MPDWRENQKKGIFKNGATYPMKKRYQILKDYAASGSFAVSARENRVSYNTARSICEKFVATGDCQPGARGRPVCKMQPFMAAYLEALKRSVFLTKLYKIEDYSIAKIQIIALPFSCSFGCSSHILL